MDEGIESVIFKIMQNSRKVQDPLMRELEPDVESTADWDFFVAHFLGFVYNFILSYFILFYFIFIFMNLNVIEDL